MVKDFIFLVTLKHNIYMYVHHLISAGSIIVDRHVKKER